MTKRKRFAKPRTAAPAGPTFDELPELGKARALWNATKYDAALSLFDDIVKKNPRNVFALTDAARAYGARFELAKAENLLDRVMQLAGNRPDVMHLAGQSMRMIHRPDKALECLSSIVERGADVPDAYLELALLCERRGDYAEAETAIDELLRREPRYAEAKIVKAVLLSRHGQFDEAHQLLRPIVEDKTGVDWFTRARASAEIARIFDQQQQYDDAMQAMIESKAVLRNHTQEAQDNAKRQKDRYTRLHAALTREDIDRWTKQGESFGRQNVALLTGPPRSGTTLLEKVIDAHPGVISSDEREAFPRYIFQALVMQSNDTGDLLPKRLDDIPRDRLLANRHHYIRFMESALGESIGDRLHLDKNPSVTPVLPGVLRLFPECRIISAVRDPRDVLLSSFMQFMSINTVSVGFYSVESGAEQYAFDMALWLNLREKIEGRYIESRYEDTVHDLSGQAKRTLDFLGCEWDESVLNYREHLKTRQTDSPTYADVAKPVYLTSIGRWKNYEKYLEPAMATLEPFIKAFGYE